MDDNRSPSCERSDVRVGYAASLSRIHTHGQDLMSSRLLPVPRQLKLTAVYVRRK